MIRKKTAREFDSAYNEWTDWPLELSYKVYSEIINEFNKYIQEKENEEVVRNAVSSTDADVE